MKKNILIILIFFFVLSSNGICFGDDLDNFLNVVKPKFNKFLSDISDLREKFKTSKEDPYDTLTFAYRLAVRRTEFIDKEVISLGQWSDKIEENFLIFLSILCPIKDLLHIRKTGNYEKDLDSLRPILVKGAYKQMIQQLTISPKAFQVQLWQLQDREPINDKNEFLLEKGIQLIRDLQ